MLDKGKLQTTVAVGALELEVKKTRNNFFCLIKYNLFLECSVLYLLQSIALLNDQKNSLRSKRDEGFKGDVARDL